MAILGWVMMGLAVWHFTVFVPDRFWGSVIGAFVFALIGSLVFGLAVNGLVVPSREDTDILTVLEGIPGSLIGMALCYWIGVRKGIRPFAELPPGTQPQHPIEP
jgi:hypothetical protein